MGAWPWAVVCCAARPGPAVVPWHPHVLPPSDVSTGRGKGDCRPLVRTSIVIIRCHYRCAGGLMRTTLALDDDLVAEAERLTGTTQKTVLVRMALHALIERESAQRLARLGGSEPALTAAPRRRASTA